MITKVELETLFKTLISTEERAVETGEQSGWYPSNWHKIDQYKRRATAVLDEPTLERFYYHLLHLGVVPGAEVKGTYSLLEKAYREHLPLMHKAHDGRLISSIQRLQGLMLFGFDHLAEVGRNDGLSDYLRYRSAYMIYQSYIHIPGMLAKPARFIPLANDRKLIERLCAIMGSLEFIHNDWHFLSEHESDFSPVYLIFWAAIYTLLLSPWPEAASTINSFKSLTTLPLRATQMNTLARYESVSSSFLAKQRIAAGNP